MNERPEPLVSAASVTSVVAACLAIVAAFGLPIGDDQQAAILGLIAAAAPLVVAVLARNKVTPVEAPRSGDGVRLIPLLHDPTQPLGPDQPC